MNVVRHRLLAVLFITNISSFSFIDVSMSPFLRTSALAPSQHSVTDNECEEESSFRQRFHEHVASTVT
jgi:hypothetical protein